MRKKKFLNGQAARAAALRLLRRLGIPYSKRCARRFYGWDGKTIATGKRESSIIVHDGAHWLICSRSRRKVPDFGLGSGPDSGWAPDRKVSYEMADREELLASLLGIAYEAVIGMDFVTTLHFHSWFDMPVEDVRKARTVFKRLERRGLLNDSMLIGAKKMILAKLGEGDHWEEGLQAV